MKVCSVTYWFCNENYGQLLQCYAYQQFLEGRGHKVVILRYKPDFGKRDRRLLKRFSCLLKSPSFFLRMIKKRIGGLDQCSLTRQARIVNSRRFDVFRNEMLHLTPKLLQSYKDVIHDEAASSMDLYSVGSDIVWGGIIPLDDDGRPYFLDFGNPRAKRISYSASFGATELSVAYRKFARPKLKRFDAVSVREESGIPLCISLGVPDPKAVLDPVFLLPRNEYVRLFDVKPARQGLYCYLLQSKVGFPLADVKKLADEKALKIGITTVYGDMGMPAELMEDPTIPEWVRKIGSSEFVVTNSFHGLSMALILHTPFAVLLKNNGQGMDVRVLTMLERAGLKDRIVQKGGFNLKSIYEMQINWDVVDAKIEKLRAESVRFLGEAGL